MNKRSIVFFLSIVIVSLSVISCSNETKKELLDGPAETVLSKDVYSTLMSQYKSIDDFSKGHAVIENAKGKKGLIDNKGNIVIDCLYERVWDFVDSYGLCYVRLNDAWGLYNSEYKMITKCLYDSFRAPNDGVITLSMNSYSIYGAVDVKDGSIIIPFEYSHLGDYSEGLFFAEKKVKGQDRYGYIDRNNATVIPFIYSDANDFSEGLAAVEKESKTVNTLFGPVKLSVCGFINKNGEIVIPFKFQSQAGPTEFSEGLCALGISKRDNIVGQTERNVFINKQGEVVISGIFDDAEAFEHGVALVKKSGKYGYINLKGEIIIPCVYDEQGYDSERICLSKVEKITCFNAPVASQVLFRAKVAYEAGYFFAIS